jgi:hypothetical protein
MDSPIQIMSPHHSLGLLVVFNRLYKHFLELPALKNFKTERDRRPLYAAFLQATYLNALY